MSSSSFAFAQTEDPSGNSDPLLEISDDVSTHSTLDFDDLATISSTTPTSLTPSSTQHPSSTGSASSSHSLFISAAPSSIKPSNRTHTPHSTIPIPHTPSTSLPFTPHRQPPATSHPDPPSVAPHTSRVASHQPVVAIVFEVIAGLVALFILLSLARCLYSWRKTPSRDRIAVLVNRHQLEREMAELEREQLERRRRQWRQQHSILVPPPPPYQRAPSYESLPEVENV